MDMYVPIFSPTGVEKGLVSDGTLKKDILASRRLLESWFSPRYPFVTVLSGSQSLGQMPWGGRERLIKLLNHGIRDIEPIIRNKNTDFIFALFINNALYVDFAQLSQGCVHIISGSLRRSKTVHSWSCQQNYRKLSFVFLPFCEVVECVSPSYEYVCQWAAICYPVRVVLSRLDRLLKNKIGNCVLDKIRPRKMKIRSRRWIGASTSIIDRRWYWDLPSVLSSRTREM